MLLLRHEIPTRSVLSDYAPILRSKVPGLQGGPAVQQYHADFSTMHTALFADAEFPAMRIMMKRDEMMTFMACILALVMNSRSAKDHDNIVK